ncbi:hypothetical protein DFH08DRAFT_698144 [Mycena albidolilacea]|uniref:Reverse transcriptase domain-containing protein n=1 Tax=Mycena albidolilacea TaxID=1033008 RepID=A0AAD7A3G9_9AGAR|nr:hypothetical protein DFH08DRAFT_698144 [Mycena albidolilacea]
MSHLEHADDMAVVSYSAEGLQRHLNTFARWCGNNMLEANATKSWVMIFGPIPSVIPVLTLNGSMVRYTDRFAYVGITFQSTARNIFTSHYAAKASTARGTRYSVLGIESYIGDLPPKEGRLLYMACIDPHLVSAADIIVDVDNTALALLEKVQRSFLRQLLGLGQHSMRAPLFTELGLVPLQYRRLILAIRYLKYLISLKPNHYAKVALEDSYDLYLNNHPGYWMDLVYALQRLRFLVELPSLPSLTAELCEKLGKAVYTAAMCDLQLDVDNSTRLSLLHGRREPLEKEKPKAITAVLRHYLVLVVNPRHQKAITRLLVSQHPLAVECLRYKKRYHKEIVPRNLRRCRFGCASVETVEHAMFFCDQTDELIQWCTTFVLAMSAQLPEILVVSTATATAVLRSLVFNRDAVCQVAKFAHYVFGVFADTALVWPEGY